MDELQASKYFLFRNSTNIPNRGADIHYHSYFEIYCLTDGECESFVNDKLYDLKPWDVVVIPPGAIHGTHYKTERHGRVLINFTFHYVPKSLMDIFANESYFLRCDDTKDEIKRIFEQIGEEDSLQDSFSEEAIRALLSRIFIIIARHARKTDSIISNENLIETAVKYVHNNYQNPLSLADIAKECNISKVHLSRKFKEKTGIGLSEYIVIYRLKKSKELLLMRDKLSICEIAYDCGFNDSNYFSWLFKKTYGVTPSQYRKNTRA